MVSVTYNHVLQRDVGDEDAGLEGKGVVLEVEATREVWVVRQRLAVRVRVRVRARGWGSERI